MLLAIIDLSRTEVSPVLCGTGRGMGWRCCKVAQALPELPGLRMLISLS
jgi:hypothetical protein